ncbi:MAG TPA: hypothetical protein VEX68_16260, partial [Bryobacteraceae bacterium]|nr:hypothetical protein [Bryobacteraceae bacterium]
MSRFLIHASLMTLVSPLFVYGSDIDRVRELNQQILSNLSTKNERHAADSNALWKERAELLGGIIAEDPASALKLLLRPEELRGLRNRSNEGFFEKTFAYSGPVESSVADERHRKRSVRSYVFESGGQTLTAFGGSGISLQCGDEARLEGYRLGGVMLVTAAAAERRADAVAECKTEGAQRVAVILVNFPGTAAAPITKAQVGDIVFGTSGRSAAAFYKEASYGQLDLTGDIYGSYTLDRAYRCGEFVQMRTAALAAADADIDFSGYSRILVVHPEIAECETSGQGTIGCPLLVAADEVFRASYAAVSASSSEDLTLTVIHELGHNLGLDHARTIRYPGTTIGPERGLATFEEYGDLFSVMGIGEAHFAVSQKVALGWVKQPEGYIAVQSAGTFDLTPLQSTGSGLKALRIKRNTGDEALWVEYRQPGGAFDRGESIVLRPMFEGALIHAQTSAAELYSDLLDFTPASVDEARQLLLPGYFTDPVLRPGQTWRDPFSDLTIEVVSMTPERLRVAVRYDTPCATVSGITDGAVISAEGRPMPISVTGGSDCSWSATASRSWVDVPGGANRKGSGTVTLEAQRHSSELPRHAAVTIERKTFAIMQSGPAARPSVTSFGPNRGSFESLMWIPTETIVTDANGIGDLKEFLILINESQTEANGCLARYDFATRTLALKVPTTSDYSMDTIRN